MFFKKFSQPAKDQKIVEATNRQPIYILGESPLALFLAAKLKLSGNNVILLKTQAPATTLKNTDFTLKEEYNLQKNNFSIPATARITTEPQMIIVAAEHYNLKSGLSLLPSKTFPDCPLISFNYIDNTEAIRPLLGSRTAQAYFKGYLEQEGMTLTAFGLLPQINITTPKNEQDTEIFINIFQNAGIKTIGSNNDRLNFWENFAPFILGYLASTPNRHILDIIGSKENKKSLHSAASDICRLAACEQIQLSESDLIRQLLETPRDFYFKKNRRQRVHNIAELDFYYSLLTDKARTYKCKVPQINLLMKNNYNELLKK